MSKPDLLDPRQRLAAALILSAIDLPADAVGWARQAVQAASVCRGVTLSQIDLGGGRTEHLIEARKLLDEMIAEKIAP